MLNSSYRSNSQSVILSKEYGLLIGTNEFESFHENSIKSIDDYNVTGIRRSHSDKLLNTEDFEINLHVPSLVLQNVGYLLKGMSHSEQIRNKTEKNLMFLTARLTMKTLYRSPYKGILKRITMASCACIDRGAKVDTTDLLLHGCIPTGR